MRTRSDPRKNSGLALLIGAFLVAVAGCSPEASLAQAAAVYRREIPQGVHDTTPVRGRRGPLQLHADGEAFACSTCHEAFNEDNGEAALEGAHAAIEFDHGSNVRCLNCHHPQHVESYVYHDGSEIPGDQPTRLCAKCHGPHFREWEMGVHGRVNGYWDARLGPQEYLNCIDCHDPHRPRFQKITPVPPPILTRFAVLAHGESTDE